MENFGPGFPEWTELSQDSGLDPLGMQRPIEAIYQSLLPGLSTITLRFRYYAFFVWMLEIYAKDHGQTDPGAFRKFQRRCEALFALIAARGGQELGVAGIDWAQKHLGKGADDPAYRFDFSSSAAPDAAPDERYLRNKGGAFGGTYAPQMFEMGLITLGDDDNPIAVCTHRGLALAEAFGAQIGDLGAVFMRRVQEGTVTRAQLDLLAPLQPSQVVVRSAEHQILVQIFLGQFSPPLPSDAPRRSTALMLLKLIERLKIVPRSQEVKWEWFGAGETEVSGHEEERRLWALYQACDLMRLAYEHILDLALDRVQEAPMRRKRLGELVRDLVSLVDIPEGISWREYAASLCAEQTPSIAARQAEGQIREAKALGEGSMRLHAILVLIAALAQKAADFSALAEPALPVRDPFQSLGTEAAFLRAQEAQPARTVVETFVRERVLKRHLWVASRKFRTQKSYTFLLEPEEGELRYRAHFRVSPSSPRLDQAIAFLRDIKLIEATGLSDDGRAELGAL